MQDTLSFLLQGKHRLMLMIEENQDLLGMSIDQTQRRFHRSEIIKLKKLYNTRVNDIEKERLRLKRELEKTATQTNQSFPLKPNLPTL